MKNNCINLFAHYKGAWKSLNKENQASFDGNAVDETLDSMFN